MMLNVIVDVPIIRTKTDPLIEKCKQFNGKNKKLFLIIPRHTFYV